MLALLPLESPNHVQHHRKHHAQQNRSGQRKIKRRVLAAIDDVPGKSTEWNIHPAEQHQHQPANYQDQSKEQQQFAQIRHRFSLEEEATMILSIFLYCSWHSSILS